MITPKGVVKVADFGLAKVYDPDDAASTIIGTPYFMPPEQVEGKVRDGRTDIYSLGVTLYYILTLKRPFDGKTPAEVLLNIMKKDPVHPREHNPDVPDAMWKIIQKMINRDVSERYATCEELLRDLRLYQESANTEERVFCPSCGFANPFSAEKCMECNNSLLDPCPVCGTPDFVDAKFCGNCGANLATEREVAALVSEAESHVAAGRIEKAIETYHAAQEVSDESSQVIEGLRRAEQTLTERDEAVKAVEAHLAEGRPLDAFAAAEEAMDRFPGHEPLGELLATSREAAQGARVTEAVDEARQRLESGELYDACAAARKALEIDGESEEARKILGDAEKALAKHSDARERASALEEDGLLEDAVTAWEEALAVVPGDQAAQESVERMRGILGQLVHHRAEGEEALAAQDFAGARTHLTDALRIVPLDPATLEVLDRLSAEEERFAGGVTGALEEFIAGRYPASREALTALAADFPGEELVGSAAAQVEALLSAAENLLESGRALLEQGLPEIASAFVRAAERISPLDSRADEILKEVKASKKAEIA
jgi:tetratricopeptide (TPR) repeat protein